MKIPGLSLEILTKAGELESEHLNQTIRRINRFIKACHEIILIDMASRMFNVQLLIVEGVM
jgi:hypothetical protein